MKIGIIGDYCSEYPSHKATNDALIHASRKTGKHIEYEWIPTASVLELMNVITRM